MNALTLGSVTGLHELLASTARRSPDRIAAVQPGVGEVTYRELDLLSDQVRDLVYSSGVKAGERVGICVPKSIEALAAVFGILKAGAAYVPVDISGPPSRNAYILRDCSVSLAILDESVADRVSREWAAHDFRPTRVVLDQINGGSGIRKVCSEYGKALPVSPTIKVRATDMAYVLYTSGSTGEPKGVPLSHGNALSFVGWCGEVFSPREEDCFSSHAPLHFDLSILDIYVSLGHGATLVLFDEKTAKNPMELARLAAEHRITIWYSTPSVLSALTQYGKLNRYDFSRLRTVLFAGEVFPLKHLRALKAQWPEAEYYNLYGPTETNVCTFHRLPREIPPERLEPFPIGKACSHVETLVIGEEGERVPAGEKGELCIRGPSVMRGYWNRPRESENAFLVDNEGCRWYRTGDIVFENRSGELAFCGRADRMVKRRGYRVELGELEAALYGHVGIREVAVVALSEGSVVSEIVAFVACEPGVSTSTIEMKSFSAAALPAYMVPDRIQIRSTLPKTSTDKIDYQALLGEIRPNTAGDRDPEPSMRVDPSGAKESRS